MGYIANYGYRDGSGEFYIIIDTDRCDVCEKCIEACPCGVLEKLIDDYDDVIIAVKESERNRIKYSCGPCKPAGGRKELPCVAACAARAIRHSW